MTAVAVRAYNRTPFVQTFLWWANVATRVHEDYQSFFPPDVHHVADHAKRSMSSYLLAPETDYERFGACNHTVLPCGAPANYEKDELWLYHGGADTCVCLAIGSLSATMGACLREI